MILGPIDRLDSIKSADEGMSIYLNFIDKVIATLILYSRTYHHFIERVVDLSL
jgi:hypothetical protein